MKLLYLTNIPAPYRIKRFNDMALIFKKRDIDVEVLFMSDVEPDRKWNVDYESMRFEYKVWPGVHPQIGNMFAHYNPTLLKRLSRNDYDAIVVGGMSCPTLWFAKWHINSSAKKIMSVETNLMGDTVKTGIKKFVKKRLLKGYDAYQVTGNPQREYVEFFNPEAKTNSFITLPNLIDPNVFNPSVIPVEKNTYDFPDNKMLCVIPARIVPGKIPFVFLEATREVENIHFVIVGNGGEYAKQVREKIEKDKLPFTIIDFVQQDMMARLYKTADMFCLPTLTDASPLSPIEAIATGLPILVSNVIGNINEVLDEGHNGFSFNVFDKESILKVLKKVDQMSKVELSQMGDVSYERYKGVFDNVNCLNRYADAIKHLIQNNQ